MNLVALEHGSTNYYVLGPADARLLVDVGMPGTSARLIALLRRKDVALSALRYMLCTHYDPDHAGAAQELKRAGVRLIVLDVQVAAVAALNAFIRRRGAGAEITLHDNVDVRLDASRAFLRGLGIAGEIVGTPGHSDDSVTLVLDDGAAFTGDLPPPELAGADDAPHVARSWSRLRALGVTRVYPGHGPVRTLPAP